jgi:hypothetical protein
MKIWFDTHKITFEDFKSEQILISPFIRLEVIEKNLDFINANKWMREAQELIHYTTLDNCDVLVFHDKLNTDIGQYIDLALKYRKPVIALYNDDNAVPTNLPKYVHVYRTSFYKSKQKENEFALPAWSDDFTNTKKICLKMKSEKPTVSFCGALSNESRQQAMDILSKNQNIQTNFLVRNEGFWGGKPQDQNIRKEYIDNMYNSDIVLCCRGIGNFSYRLYETMSLGKIPLIVDSDLVMPFENEINWKKLTIWVDSVDKIDEAVVNFWNSINETQYKDLQLKIRKFYEEYVSPIGFIKQINRIYENSNWN